MQSKVPTWSDTKYAFVCYDYPEDAAEAAKNATRIGSSNLKVEYGKKDTGSNDIPTSKSLIVRNINLHHTTKAVRAMLETFGQIKYMTAMRRPAYSVSGVMNLFPDSCNGHRTRDSLRCATSG